MPVKTKKDTGFFLPYWFVFFFMLLTALACLPFLPATVPTHWDGNWHANDWGSKWTVLLFPFADAAALPVLNFIFTATRGKYAFGSMAAFDPDDFLYRFWLVVSLFFCAPEMLMLAQSFHAAFNVPRFLLFVLAGAVLILVAVWKNRRKPVSWFLEAVGFLLMLASLA